MFRNKKNYMREDFKVGNANMDTTSCEIKLTGAVSHPYAKALNDREANVSHINSVFSAKNKSTDEFIEKNHNRYPNGRIVESIDDIKISKRADALAKNIEDIVDDINKLNWEDFTTVKDIKMMNDAAEALYRFSAAYSNIMDGEDVFESVAIGNEKIDAYVELRDKVEADGDEVSQKTIDELNNAAIEVAVEAVDEIRNSSELDEDDTECPICHNADCTCTKATEKLVDQFIDIDEQLDAFDNLEDAPAKLVDEYVEVAIDLADIIADEATVELKEAVDAPVKPKRVRSANVKKEDRLYSDDDLWLQVYDELSSEVDNEGPTGEVKKQIKTRRGNRYVGPYAGSADDEMVIYGTSEKDFDFAKEVAKHYGADIRIFKDNNRRTNQYYPYTAVVKVG